MTFMPQPHHPPHSSTGPVVSRNYALISWLLACLALLYIGSSLFRLYQHKHQIEAQMAQQPYVYQTRS